MLIRVPDSGVVNDRLRCVAILSAAVRRFLLLGCALIAGCGSSTTTVIVKTASGSASTPTHSTPAMATTGVQTETLRVTSPGMLPTVSVGQLVTVSLDPSYVPSVGDIVLFHPPSGAEPATPMCGRANQGAGYSQVCDAPTSRESSLLFIKRVVAGPGDRVTITQGHVVRNGVTEQDASYTEPCGADPSCNFQTPVTIPPSDYFLLGDNRGASDDSRFWGPVPKAWVIGKVEG